VEARADRREEHEPLRAGTLGGAHQPQRGDRVQLLDRRARLVADRRGEVHDRVDPAQRVAKRRRVGQVPQRDLHAHPLGSQPSRIPHEAAHPLPRGDEAPQHG
jgi:hypothetical protein